MSNDFIDPNVPAEAPFPPISVRIRLQKPTDVKRFLSQDGYAEPESRIRKEIIRFRPVRDQHSSTYSRPFLRLDSAKFKIWHLKKNPFHISFEVSAWFYFIFLYSRFVGWSVQLSICSIDKEGWQNAYPIFYVLLVFLRLMGWREQDLKMPKWLKTESMVKISWPELQKQKIGQTILISEVLEDTLLKDMLFGTTTMMELDGFITDKVNIFVCI